MTAALSCGGTDGVCGWGGALSEGWGGEEVVWGTLWSGSRVSGSGLSYKPHGQEGNGSSDMSAGHNSSQGYLEGQI